jgi:predicted transcriptional regulator
MTCPDGADGPLARDERRGREGHRERGHGDERRAQHDDVDVRTAGYTAGMKTAVSVPDDLFAQVDRLAKRSRRSRSEVYSAALREYVARHAPDEVTAGLDAVLSDIGQPDVSDFTDAAALNTLGSSEW